jgi:Peptidase family M28
MAAIHASGVMATSMTTELYHRIPGVVTDLAVFDEAGFRGLNFALVGGSSMYHTANDTIGHVDRSTLQQMGAAALAAAHQLAEADLQDEGTPDVTYFTVAGTLVHYPNALTVPLAGLVLLGYALTVRLACRRSERASRVATAATTFLAPVGIAVAIGSCVWALLNAMRPDYADFLTGDIPTASRYAWGEALLVVAVVAAWYLLVRRWHTVTEVALGVTGWFTAFACVTAVVAPGAAYPFIAIALVATTAIAAATRWSAQDSSLRLLACTVAGIPAAALVLPLVVMLFPALGISHAAVPLVLVALSAGVLAPLLEGVRGRVARIAVLAAAALVAVGLIAVGVHADT